MKESKVFIQGVSKTNSEEELSKIIEKVFLKSTNNLSWLSKGDKVLLKPALNSSDPYPATTHPLSLKVIAEILEKRGAKVIVADQSGIEHVLQDETGIIKGSSEGCFKKSGMAESDTNFVSLESRGWNSFYNFKSDKTSSWKNGFYITDLIKEVDHIINLPRLSTHGQAGVSLGFKNMVGLLREDSRVEFHKDGPLYSFAKKNIKNSNLHKVICKDKSNNFFEKITEINLATEDKLRLTLFTATKAQVTMGPDKYVTKIAKKVFASYQMEPETGLVFASSNQIAAEIIALAFLTLLYKQAPVNKKFIQKVLVGCNGKIKELGKENVWENPFIKHALKINLGEEAIKPQYENIPESIKKELDELIKTK